MAPQKKYFFYKTIGVCFLQQGEKRVNETLKFILEDAIIPPRIGVENIAIAIIMHKKGPTMQKYLTTTALASFVAFALAQPVSAQAEETKVQPKTHAQKKARKNLKKTKVKTVKPKASAPHEEHDVFDGEDAPGRAAEVGEPDRKRITPGDENKLSLSVSGELAVEATATHNKERGGYSADVLEPNTHPDGDFSHGFPNVVYDPNRNFFVRSNTGNNVGRAHHFGVADANITFTVSTQVKDWRVGGNIELSGMANDIQNAKKAYISAENNKVGDVYFGNAKGVTAVLRRNGTTMQAGNINADGNWKNTIFLSDGALLSNKMVGDTSSATKIAYYSPFIGGLRLAVSYTPNTDHRGDAILNSRSDLQPRLDAIKDGKTYTPTPFFNNSVVEGAIQFVKEIKGLKIDASLLGIIGKTSDRYIGGAEVDLTQLSGGVSQPATFRNPLPTGFRNIKSWEAGVNLAYHGVEAGAGYRNNGKSNTAPLSRPSAFSRFVNAGSAWNLGLGYRWGKTFASLEYAQSQRKYMPSSTLPIQNVKTHFYGVNGEHKIAPGMLAYAQAGTFKIDSNVSSSARTATNRNNKGNTFTLGTRLLF